MLQTLKSILYPSIPAEFTSTLPLETCIENLRVSVGRNMFASLWKRDATYGAVFRDDVEIRRLFNRTDFSHPYFAVFYGKFENQAGTIILRGHFTPSTWSKVFMTIWFSFFILAFLPMAVTHLIGTLCFGTVRPIDFATPFFALPFIIFGLFMLHVSWRSSRRDIAFIATLIQSALQTPSLKSSADDAVRT